MRLVVPAILHSTNVIHVAERWSSVAMPVMNVNPARRRPVLSWCLTPSRCPSDNDIRLTIPRDDNLRLRLDVR